jgi:indolepyruvate ferredoxin oxidoreductase beta subunit
MNNVKNVILCGVGGQGTILASRILSTCLIDAGYDVKMSEIHGMSQRGGNVTTQVRYGDKVYSPIIGKGSADVLVSFEKLEALRNLEDVRVLGGTVIINDYAIPSLPTLQGMMEYPADAAARVSALIKNTKIIDATGMATELGNPKSANVVLLGATVKALGLEDLDWDSAMGTCIAPKFLEMNKKAFKVGLEA